MAYDQSATSALQQLGLLNKQFGDAMSPLNNFVGMNTQLAVQEQRNKQEQINKLEQISLQAQLNSQLQKQQQESAIKLSQVVHSAEKDQALEVAKFTAQHMDNRESKAQADKIRTDPQARLILGNKIGDYSDTPDDNRKLVADYVKAVSDPNVLEKVNLDQAVGLTKEIKTVLGSLSSGLEPNSPQSKRAVQEFLATPGVTDILIKKGGMTANEIAAVANGGDPSKIKNVIDRVASDASWIYGQDKNVLSQLTGAWNQALAKSGATPGPDQLVNANYLNTLLARRDAVAQNLQLPASWKSLTEAHGLAAPQNRLPPPTAASGVSQPLGMAAPPLPQSPNPFSPPTPNTDKVGLAAMLSPTAASDAWSNVLNRTGIPGGSISRAGAFAPPQVAQDPYTELEARKRILQSVMEQEQFKAGLTQGIPLVPNYQPKYDPYQQTQDEQTLQALVRGLYGQR